MRKKLYVSLLGLFLSCALPITSYRAETISEKQKPIYEPQEQSCLTSANCLEKALLKVNELNQWQQILTIEIEKQEKQQQSLVEQLQLAKEQLTTAQQYSQILLNQLEESQVQIVNLEKESVNLNSTLKKQDESLMNVEDKLKLTEENLNKVKSGNQLLTLGLSVAAGAAIIILLDSIKDF